MASYVVVGTAVAPAGKQISALCIASLRYRIGRRPPAHSPIYLFLYVRRPSLPSRLRMRGNRQTPPYYEYM